MKTHDPQLDWAIQLVPDFVPEDVKLKTKDLVALFDEKPSTVKWWLDSGQLESWPKSKSFRHRYTIPAAVVLFEMEYLPPTKRANWDALLYDEMI